MPPNQRMKFCYYLIIVITIFTFWGMPIPIEAGEQKDSGLSPTEAEKGSKTITLAFLTSKCAQCNRLINLLYTEALQRFGYKFNYETHPPQRSLIEANSGRIDGLAARLEFDADLKRQYPNLIQVEEQIWSVSTGAYSHNPALHIESWESLGNQNLLVGYADGMISARRGVKKYVRPDNGIAATDVYQGLKMLKAKRIDVFVDSDITIRNALENDEFKGVGFTRVGTVERYPLYPYLHKKHAEIAPKLAAALKAMKKDGTFKDL